MKHYIIRDGKIDTTENLMEWAQFFEQADRTVAHTELPHGGHLSTVFMAVDHNFSRSGPPVLFESMSFEDDRGRGRLPEGGICERYETIEQALEGHREILRTTLSYHSLALHTELNPNFGKARQAVLQEPTQ